MAFKHGRKGELWLDALDASPFFSDAEVSTDVEMAPVDTFKGTWKKSISGQANGALSAAGYYDPTYAGVRTTLQEAADSVLTFGPAGMAAIGDLARLIAVVSAKYGESSKIGAAVAFKWEVKGDGNVGFGYTLHPLGADVNTTTGAERDDAAATVNGWIAHLHVLAVTGGSWVVKLQDAAVTNTYSDLAGGAFTAATTATQQRLTGTGTLRRFVRYVATRTGGVGGDSITFGLAIARI